MQSGNVRNTKNAMSPEEPFKIENNGLKNLCALLTTRALDIHFVYWSVLCTCCLLCLSKCSASVVIEQRYARCLSFITLSKRVNCLLALIRYRN